MRTVARALACLACVGQARKLQVPVSQTTSDNAYEAQALAHLLQSLSPEAGWQAMSAAPGFAAAAPRSTAEMQLREMVVTKPFKKKSPEFYAAIFNGIREEGRPLPWRKKDTPWPEDKGQFEEVWDKTFPFFKAEGVLEDALMKCKSVDDVEKAIATCKEAGGRDESAALKTAAKFLKEMKKAEKEGKKAPKAKAKKASKAGAKAGWSAPGKELAEEAATHDNSII